jgi:hypothetical protein
MSAVPDTATKCAKLSGAPTSSFSCLSEAVPMRFALTDPVALRTQARQ